MRKEKRQKIEAERLELQARMDLIKSRVLQESCQAPPRRLGSFRFTEAEKLAFDSLYAQLVWAESHVESLRNQAIER
eukprot:10740161-Prorocentrum_lima.AAC.1